MADPGDALDQAYGYNPAPLRGLPQNFTDFVEDLKAHGYDPEFMGGYRAHGSVPGSLHPKYRALDISQYSRNVVTPKFQAFINANPGLIEQLARKHGLRSGSTFHTLGPDTGHFDMPDDSTLVLPTAPAAAPASDPADTGTTPAAPGAAPAAATNDEALMALLSRLSGGGDALSRQQAPVYGAGAADTGAQTAAFSGDALAPGRGGGGGDMQMLLLLLMELLGAGQQGGSTYGGSAGG